MDDNNNNQQEVNEQEIQNEELELQEEQAEQKDIENNIKEVEEGIKDSARLAKNAASGNIVGAAKDAIKLTKNKKVRKKLILQAIMPIIGIILVGAIVFGIFSGVGEVISNTIGGIWNSIVDFFTVSDDGAIEISTEQIDTIINSIEEMGVSTEDLGIVGDYDESGTNSQEAIRMYIRDFYEAQAVTETLNYQHRESTDTVTYGAVYVYRANENDEDGTNRRELTYIEYEDMVEMQENGNTNALNHFSIDEEGKLVIAGTNEVIVETGSAINSLQRESDTLTINLRSIDYRSAISQYTTKMNFLVYLTMISQNPEFVSAVTDLIKDSRIEITIMDNVSTYVSTEQYDYTLHTRERVVRTPNQDSQAQGPSTFEPTYVSYEDSEQDVTEITRTTTISTNPSANITYVKTWFCEQSVSYNRTTQSTDPVSTPGPSIEDEPAVTGNNEGSWRTDQSITITETTTNQTYSESSRTDVEITLGNRGDGARYANGEISEPTFVGLMETEFRIPYANRTEIAGFKLDEGSGMLFSLLQQDPDLESMETIMRHALNLFLGEEQYEVDLSRFDLFEVTEFSSVGTSGSSNSLKEYIRHFEHSSTPPTNADGTKYIIEAGAVGEPVVGYGVDVNSHLSLFISAGYSTEIGAEVDKEFVDAIEEEIMNSYYNQVQSITSGLNLKEYQIQALTSRAYNCGVSGALSTERGSPAMNFVNSYNAYWDDETDDLFEERNNNANFNHSLYTQYMSRPTTSRGQQLAGLETRRRSEWTLFQTGYYDVLGEWYAEGGGSILEAADAIHQAQITWTYSTGGDLYWNDIEMSINNPNRVTCCATYVSSVLYRAECFSLEQMNSFNYNSSNSLYSFLGNNGWQRIDSYGELEAGDIVFMDTDGGARNITHVQIYAGNGTWYNAGSTSSIQRASPYSSDASGGFIAAYRQP